MKGSFLWEKYSSREMGDVVDVQELANWALRLHPRSVQDFKPLFILLQGILKELLSGKMNTFSGELLELKDRLAEVSRKCRELLVQTLELPEEYRAHLKGANAELYLRTLTFLDDVNVGLKEAMALSVGDEDVREVLLQREEQEKRLTLELAKYRADLEATRTNMQDLRLERNRLGQERDALQAERDQLRAELAETRQTVEAQAGEIAGQAACLAAAHEELAGVKFMDWTRFAQEDQTHWRALLQEPCADIKYALASGTAGAALALSNYPDRGEAVGFLCQMPIGLALQTLGAMHPAMAAGYLGGVFERAPEAAVHMFGKIAPAEAGAICAELQQERGEALAKAYRLELGKQSLAAAREVQGFTTAWKSAKLKLLVLLAVNHGFSPATFTAAMAALEAIAVGRVEEELPTLDSFSESDVQSITKIQAVQRGRLARKQGGGTAGAKPKAAEGEELPALDSFSEADVKNIAKIQAVQKGRRARKQVAGLSAEREKQAAEEAAAAAAAKVAHLTFPHFNATDTAAEVSQSVRLTNAIIEITEALHKKAKKGVRRYPTDDNPDHRLFAVELAGEVLGQVVADLTAMGPKLAAFLLADTSAVVAAKVLGALDAPTFVLVSRELGAMKEKLRGQFAVDEAAQLGLNAAFDKITLEESHPRPAERMPLFVRGPAQGVLDQVLRAHGVRATVCFIPEGVQDLEGLGLARDAKSGALEREDVAFLSSMAVVASTEFASSVPGKDPGDAARFHAVLARSGRLTDLKAAQERCVAERQALLEGNLLVLPILAKAANGEEKCYGTISSYNLAALDDGAPGAGLPAAGPYASTGMKGQDFKPGPFAGLRDLAAASSKIQSLSTLRMLSARIGNVAAGMDGKGSIRSNLVLERLLNDQELLGEQRADSPRKADGHVVGFNPDTPEGQDVIKSHITSHIQTMGRMFARLARPGTLQLLRGLLAPPRPPSANVLKLLVALFFLCEEEERDAGLLALLKDGYDTLVLPELGAWAAGADTSHGGEAAAAESPTEAACLSLWAELKAQLVLDAPAAGGPASPYFLPARLERCMKDQARFGASDETNAGRFKLCDSLIAGAEEGGWAAMRAEVEGARRERPYLEWLFHFVLSGRAVRELSKKLLD